MLVIILLCYSLAGALGLQIASVNGAVTPLWAPTGIAIAAMVLYGYRVWPAVFFGSIVTGIISHDAPFTILIGASAGIVEAFIATYFLNRYANGKNTFDTVRTTVLFILFSGILSTMIGATIGADGLV